MGIVEFPGAGRPTLLRDMDQSHRFISFGTWQDLEQIEAFRRHAEFARHVARIQEALDDFYAGDLRGRDRAIAVPLCMAFGHSFTPSVLLVDAGIRLRLAATVADQRPGSTLDARPGRELDPTTPTGRSLSWRVRRRDHDESSTLEDDLSIFRCLNCASTDCCGR